MRWIALIGISLLAVGCVSAPRQQTATVHVTVKAEGSTSKEQDENLDGDANVSIAYSASW